MKFSIYQINFTKEQVVEINNTDLSDYSNAPDFYMARLQTTESYGTDPRERIETVQKYSRFYSHVANIEASDLDEVFEIGNIGPERKIERLAPMHSVSVGDVITVDSVNGQIAFIVASEGFVEIPSSDAFFKEAA